MTLKVVIQPTINGAPFQGDYPVFYTQDDGVRVGSAGELMLVADRRGDADPCLKAPPSEFRIYAPGTWKEVNVSYIEDGE